MNIANDDISSTHIKHSVNILANFEMVLEDEMFSGYEDYKIPL